MEEQLIYTNSRFETIESVLVEFMYEIRVLDNKYNVYVTTLPFEGSNEPVSKLEDSFDSFTDAENYIENLI